LHKSVAAAIFCCRGETTINVKNNKQEYVMSLLSGIMSMATPFIVDRIAAALGINSGLARTAINLALPALLNAFAGKAATPSGAAALYNAVSSADTGLLNNLEKSLSGPNKDAFINSSNATLSNLLGGGAVSQLANTLTSKAGLGGTAASMLVPLVGQMALSGLAKNTAGLDATGLAKLLASEQQSFAMPELGATVTNIGAKVGDTIPRATIPSPPMPAAAPGGDLMKWIIPLVAVLGLGWYFLGNRPPMAPTAEQAAPAQQTTEAAPAAVAGVVNIDGIDVTKSLTDVMGGMTSVLGSVTDATTAQAALPKITELTGTVDKVAGVAGKFTPENKTAIGALITAGLPAVRAAADKVLAQQGVGDILKPAVDGIFGKIEALAK
jgi:hypothetical protein